MKSFQRLCAAAALTITFALPVCAGDISTGLGTAPPPPSQAMAPGDIPSPPGVAGETAGGEAVAPLTEIALGLLHGVLSLL